MSRTAPKPVPNTALDDMLRARRPAGAVPCLLSTLALLLACSGCVPEPDASCGPPPDDRLRWSPWLDRDDPTGTGDWELMDDFAWEEVGCLVPIAVQATTLSCAPAPLDDPEIQITPMIGLRCENAPTAGEAEGPGVEPPAPTCADYQVRFGCADPDWDALPGRWVEEVDRRQGTLETWIPLAPAMSSTAPVMTFEADGVFVLGAVGPDGVPLELRGAWQRQGEQLMLNWTDAEERAHTLALSVGDIRPEVLMVRRRSPPAAGEGDAAR